LYHLRKVSVSLPEDNVHDIFRKCQSGIFSISTLAKIAPDFPDFIGCKSTHFSQISQAFLSFSSLSRIIHSLTLPRNCQNAQYETFAEISFFANDFAIKVVSISQRTIVYELIQQLFSLVPSLLEECILYVHSILCRADRC